LKKAFGDLFDQLELVEADLLDAKSMELALNGSDYIVHTASPFPLDKPSDEMELIKPAVEGTLAVMNAAKANKCKKSCYYLICGHRHLQ
jgi:dihydroflavonol-4-reductase